MGTTSVVPYTPLNFVVTISGNAVIPRKKATKMEIHVS
jgi:hypothetical protein